jgi:hypothetical protein
MLVSYTDTNDTVLCIEITTHCCRRTVICGRLYQASVSRHSLHRRALRFVILLQLLSLNCFSVARRHIHSDLFESLHCSWCSSEVLLLHYCAQVHTCLQAVLSRLQWVNTVASSRYLDNTLQGTDNASCVTLLLLNYAVLYRDGSLKMAAEVKSAYC